MINYLLLIFFLSFLFFYFINDLVNNSWELIYENLAYLFSLKTDVKNITQKDLKINAILEKQFKRFSSNNRLKSINLLLKFHEIFLAKPEDILKLKNFLKNHDSFLKNADKLNLVGLTKSVNDLANRARNNKLQPDDVKDGTFTITNVGSFGNVMGTPIINQPQVAILAIGAIKKKPAVIETREGDMIAIRHMMFLSLPYDHRVVDGALGGSFLRKVADYLEKWDLDRTV